MKTNALRVAAYILAAHFLIVTGFAFLGKGAPDFVRIFVSFGFLLASVLALFAPRKRGWFMVIAYALYVSNPHLIGIFTVWSSSEMPSATKIVTSVVIALIHAPLVVALVLIFKPGSFAAFKSPLPGEVAKDAPISKP